MSAHQVPDIVSVKRMARYRRYDHPSPGFDGEAQTGEDVTMRDGSIWFQPYDGSKPRKVT
jgi:hypothetical protein